MKAVVKQALREKRSWDFVPLVDLRYVRLIVVDEQGRVVRDDYPFPPDARERRM